MTSLGKSYQDNRAVLQYQLHMRSLEVAEELLQHAPRPIVINSQEKDGSALSTLLMAQILPQIMKQSTRDIDGVNLSSLSNSFQSMLDQE